MKFTPYLHDYAWLQYEIRTAITTIKPTKHILRAIYREPIENIQDIQASRNTIGRP